MKFLIPVDGSASANHAVEWLINSAGWLKGSPQIFLINVQWKLSSGNVKMFISQDTIEGYYQEQSMAALAEARKKLGTAGLTYHYHISIGTPAEAIVQYAEEQKIDQIIMGAHGQGALSTFLLGSVVSKVLHLASMPVLLVK